MKPEILGLLIPTEIPVRDAYCGTPFSAVTPGLMAISAATSGPKPYDAVTDVRLFDLVLLFAAVERIVEGLDGALFLALAVSEASSVLELKKF